MRSVLLIFLLITRAAGAQEVREFYNGIRGLGMGGAAIATVNDETALLVNPAGLGKLRDFFGTIIDPDIDFSAGMYSMYRTTAFTDPVSISQIARSLNDTRDTYYHYRWQLFPSVVVKNFGLGIFYRTSLDAQMSADGTSMQTNYYNDLALVLGYNLRLFDGRIKIGFVGKAISRVEVAEALDPTGNLDLGTIASEGFGLSTDVGLMLAGPWVWLPTIAAVARDVGGTNFNSSFRMSTSTRPTPITQDIDVGIGLFPIHSNKTRSSFSVELKKLTAYGQAVNKSRHYHVGYEYNYADVVFLRLGMNQQFYTLGAELASEHTQFQLATYGEDVGTDGNPVEDRRYTVKFVFRF